MPRVEAGRTGRFAKTNLYPALRDVVELRAAALGEREPMEGSELSAAGNNAGRRKSRCANAAGAASRASKPATGRRATARPRLIPRRH